MSIGPIDQYGLLPANSKTLRYSLPDLSGLFRHDLLPDAAKEAQLGSEFIQALEDANTEGQYDSYLKGRTPVYKDNPPVNTSNSQGEEDMSSISNLPGANSVLGQWPGADQLYDLSGADVVVQRRSPLEEALGSSLLRAAKNLTDQGLNYSGDARAQIADFSPLQQQAIDEMDRVPLIDPQTGQPALDPSGNPDMVSPFDQNQMI